MAANKAAAEAAAEAQAQPAGGINQPQYAAPRGGPTWADTPAGRELRKQYEASGVVFNERGDVIYNPADMGAAEVERARAARGEAPSYKTTGEPSPAYAAAVYTQSKRTQQAVRSNVEQVNRQRDEAQRQVTVQQERITSLKAREAALAAQVAATPQSPMLERQLAAVRLEMSKESQVLNKLSMRLGALDSARTSLAKQEMAVQKDITQSALSLGSARTTKGPVDTGIFSSSRQYPAQKTESASPQRQRVQAATGIKEKLYANPLFRDDAESYMRPNIEAQQVRYDRPKAISGVQDKMFINPNYVTKQEQRSVDSQKSIFSISLDQTPRTAQPNAFAISLTEGAPVAPKQITQAEFDAMTPQQQAQYNADIAAYNKYVNDYNKSQKEAARQARAQNIITWKQSKSELLLDIANLKKQGVTTLTAQTTQGPKDIPINNAFKALSSGKIGGANILGVGVAPNIPEGYTVTGLSSQMLVPTKETSERLLREEQRKQIERDPTGLSKFIYAEEMATEKGTRVYGPTQPGLKTELQRSGAQYYSLVGSGVGSFFNLAYTGSSVIYKTLGVEKLAKAYEKVPRVYQAKPTGGEQIFEAPIVAGMESIEKGNATAFLPTLQKEVVTGFKAVSKAPIGAIVGQGAGLFALAGGPVPGRGTVGTLSKLSPIKYTPVVTQTGKGAERVASVITIGYNPKTSKYVGGVLGAEEKYKPFIGTPDWSRMGLERITPPTGSSFDVYEFAAYNKQQSKPIYDLFRYGEKTGAVKPGTVEQQILENIERAKQAKMKVKYERTLPVQIEGIPLRESEMQSMQQAISVIQKKGYTESGKGSLIQNMMSGWPRRAQGDLLDLDIKIPKNTEKIMKDVENLRYRAAEAAKKGDYEKQQKLLAKAEKREAKVYEKGEKAVDYILSNVKMEPGRALGRKGFNIVVGEAEGTPKIAEESGMILYHGTSPTNAQRILRQGLSFEKSRTSESTLFTSTDTRGAYGVAGVTLEIKMRPAAKILDVNKEGMAGWDDPRIREYARKNKYDLIKNLMQGQQSYGEEIEIVSSKNILSIKPTKTSVPKTIYDVPTGRYIKNNIREISGEWINPNAKMAGVTLFRNRPFKSSDYKQFVPGLKTEKKSILSDEGTTYYHGTKTARQKQSIIERGPDIPEDTGFFLSPKKTGYFSASEFGKELVQVKIKPEAKILKVSDDFLVEGKEIDDILEEGGIEFAKRKGYQGIDRPISVMRGGEGERELILFSKEPIQSISDISKTSKGLEFHHIVKGEKKYGVPLTFEEHKGITALQGQLGKIPYIPGQEKALALLGERGQYSADISKNLARLSPTEKTQIRTTLLQAAKEATKLERPTIKKDTGKEVLNMIGYKEKLTDETAELLGNVERPFGEKWPKATTKFRVKDEKGQVVTYKIGYQSMAKFKAISGIQSAESIAADYSHSQEWKDKLLGGARLVKSPKSYRYEKDPLDAYMLTYRNIKYQYEKGDILGARESVQTALGMRKYYTGYDFIAGAKTFKSVSDIEVPATPRRSTTQAIQSISGRAGVTSGRLAPSAAGYLGAGTSTQEKTLGDKFDLATDIIMRGGGRARPTGEPPKESPSTKIQESSGLQRISPIQIVSARAPSARSAMTSVRSSISGRSPLSVRSVSSPRSPGISASVSPSISARLSSRSAGISARSVKSPFTKSPDMISPKSPRPSPKSPGISPSISPRSVTSPKPYGTSPLSPVLSPKTSPISPLYPIKPLEPKPIFPPSPRRIPKFVPFLKNTTDKTKMSKKDQLEFFGSTHAASILGFRSKKKDFDYAKDLSGKAVQDIRTTDPIKKSPLTKKRSGMILSSPKRYFTPTKKQSKNFLKMRL